MKRALMIGVAAGALLAGVNIAASQSTMERQPGAAGSGGANTEQKSGSGQRAQDAQKQDAQKQGDQKQDAQKQGDQQKGKDAQKQGDQQKGKDAQKQGDQQKAQDAQKQGDQQKGAQKPDQKQDAQSKDAPKSGQAAGSGQAGGGGKVTLSTEQKTKVRETVIRSSNAPRVTNVNFSVTVGTAIPREVRLAPLPPLLVEIYPDWRSYQYIIVEERILIIEPSSFKIIAIIEV